MKTKLISFLMLTLIGLNTNAMSLNTTDNSLDSIRHDVITQALPDSINTIMTHAKEGDARAMNEVGIWYYTGKYVDKDYSQAYDWWKKAAMKSDLRAIANLGLCYQYGHGVEADSIDAIRLYEKSIKDGNTILLRQRSDNAMHSPFDAMLVGQCYEKGIGVAKNYLKAAEFYSFAAALGSVEGMRQAGICYLNGRDAQKAIDWFQKGAEAGDLSSTYWSGKILLGGMNVPAEIDRGLLFINTAADRGMPAAQNELATLYADGICMDQDLETAAELFHKAAASGFSKAMWNYGNVLKEGRGTAQDFDQALFWMAEAASQGYLRAFKGMVSRLDSVGNDPFLSYIKGMKLFLVDENLKGASDEFKKVEKAKVNEGKIMQAVIMSDPRTKSPDVKKAIKELEKLSHTDSEAAFYLGQIYETNNDLAKAIELYTKSSEMGSAKAQNRLADIYFEGRGIEKNIEKAINLYQLAYENRQLSKIGAERLAECYELGTAGLTKDKEAAEKLRKTKDNNNLQSLLQNLNI